MQLIRKGLLKFEVRVCRKTGTFPPFLRFITGRRLTRIAMVNTRCQEKSFSDFQGFSGKTIDHFPPCRFFKISLTEPEKAYDAFCEWLRECLIDHQAWKIPRSEGGWENGTLIKSIFQLHQEHGLSLSDISKADPTLIDEAIGRKTDYYFELFNSIKLNGYDRSHYPPITCFARNGHYILHNGHHRASALWVLGYQHIDVEILGDDRYQRSMGTANQKNGHE